jgi:hypothetical protein
MKLRIPTPTVTVLALALLATAGPAAGQTLQDDDLDTAAAGTPLIAIHARVTDLDTNQREAYRLEPDPVGSIPLRVGDRVRIELVGTAIVDDVGIAVEVPARFEVAAGSWRLGVAASDDNSVIVEAQRPDEARRGRDDALSALAYTVIGNYDLKDALREGRITFEIGPRGGLQQPAPSRPVQGEARWREAEDIARALSFIRLGEQRQLDDALVERIYVEGYQGVRDVASLLAEETANVETFERWEQDDLLARLYRHLLERRGDEQKIADEDPQGFRYNLSLLEREGYRALVLALVGSEEFRRVHDLDDFETLPRTERSRRPLLRETRPGG